MNKLILAITISVNLFPPPGECLDKTQLIGNRIPFLVEPQAQYLNSVAVDHQAGNYFLLWTRNNYKVYGRLFGPKGGKIAPLQSFVGGVMPGQQRYERGIAAVYNPIDRKYLVIWLTFFGNLANPVAREYRGQFVTSQGRAVGTSWVITKEKLGFRNLLHNSKDNQYVLFYWIAEDQMSPRILYLQRLDAQGQQFGAARKICSPSSGNSTDISNIAYDPRRNQYLVVWESGGSQPNFVKYRTVSADLMTLGTVYTVDNKKTSSAKPLALYDPYKKRFIIIWRNQDELMLRGISLSGSPQMDVVFLGTFSFRFDDFTAALNGSNGSILLGYNVDDRPGDPVCLQRIRSNFSRLGEEFFGSSQFNDRTSNPLLYFNSFNQEFMLIWSYLDWGPNSEDYYGQRIRGIPLDSSQK